MYDSTTNSNANLKWDQSKDQEIFGNADLKLIERFRKFHEENPVIYFMFFDKAIRIFNMGRKRYSAWIIMNVIRWEMDLKTSGDEFKINNDFIAMYTRLLIWHHPIFDGFFELRTMKPHRVQLSDEQRQRVLRRSLPTVGGT